MQEERNHEEHNLKEHSQQVGNCRFRAEIWKSGEHNYTTYNTQYIAMYIYIYRDPLQLKTALGATERRIQRAEQEQALNLFIIFPVFVIVFVSVFVFVLVFVFVISVIIYPYY